MKTLLLAFTALLLPAFAQADCGATPDREDYYFDSSAVVPSLLAPVPSEGSPEDRADLEGVREWQRKRTPQMCAAFTAQKNPQARIFFSRMPIRLTPTKEKILCQAASDVWKAVSRLKEHFHRLRPGARDSSITTCPGGSNEGLSYPSGHAALSRIYALVFAEVDPANRELYEAEARQAALNRLIGAVHHPLDIAEGAGLAEKMFETIRRNPQFQRDVETLKQAQ